MSERDAYAVLDRAAVNHKPCAFYALFSGGHDSLTATTLAFEWADLRGVKMWAAHINTGTGVPETSEFVRSVCRDNGWPLRELRPPRSYESIVLEFGFPGPAQHGLMYQRLKERCLAQLVRESKSEWKDRVMFITGVRADESLRRMRHVEQEQREGAKVWAAPIWDWSKLDCNTFLVDRGIPRNPVVDVLHMSGECLCGSFAKPGEIKELEQWYPEVAQRIHALETRVEAKGLRGCVWGKRPPNVHRDQMKFGMLCQGCAILDGEGSWTSARRDLHRATDTNVKRTFDGEGEKCPTCGGTDREGGTVATMGPDEFGNYETDDCPDEWHR